jgi:HEAT repeat protein
MNPNSSADQLIKDLLIDPARFTEQGKSYQLLQHYFNGYDVESLRPLLSHKNSLVRRSAAFVASELGGKAGTLVHNVVPLIHDDADRHTQWYATECIAVCSTGQRAEQYVAVVRQMENDDVVMRLLAMRLVTHADPGQLAAALEAMTSSGEAHEAGLRLLLKGDAVDGSEVMRMLNSPEPVARKYAAIAAKKLFSKNPNLLRAATTNSDSDVSQFAIEAIQRESS